MGIGQQGSMTVVTHKDQGLPTTVFAFIRYFLRAHRGAVAIYICLALAAGFWGPFNSVLVKNVIDLLPQVKDGEGALLMVPAGLIVLNFILFDNFTWRGINYVRAKHIPLIINRIVAEMMDHCLAKSHQFYQDNLSGKISKNITNLSDAVEKLITRTMANFLRGGSLLITAFIAAYFVNPIFCLILIVWFAFFATVHLLMSKKLVSLSDAQAAAESTVVGELVDSFANHSNIRIFSRRTYEGTRMAPFFQGQQRAYTNAQMHILKLHVLQGGLIALMMAFCVYFLAYLYGKGAISVGDFALILGLSMETGHMMWFTMSEVDEFNQAVGRCKQTLTALMLPVEIVNKPRVGALQCLQGTITFKDVKFHYKGTTPLFQDKNVTIPGGQKVGLVGYSGGGKSTFAHLILRLYDVTDGAILIDGQDIRDVTQESLRENIAMIPQDPILFHRSLMENIRYGRLEASDAAVWEAAQKAHAHGFIEHLPQGYAALVGERGVKLSGGQRQRIAIARAILKNAPILILDEATSQLDSLTESLIQDSLWTLMQGKTTLVIAHRLSTLLHMDRILVFDKGQIVEDGPHDVLLARNGVYKQLWEAQVGGFLGDDHNKIFE